MKQPGIALSIFALASLVAITGRALESPSFFRALPPTGRIPIEEPTIITQPGHYFLVEDVTVNGGAAIEIQASGVTLDLNGHTATNLATIGHVISIAQDSKPVWIRNGNLIGGDIGIRALPNSRIKASDVDISGSDENSISLIEPERFEIVSCRISGGPGANEGAIHITGSLNAIPSTTGRIHNNLISSPRTAILMARTSGSQIVDNIIDGGGSPENPGAWGGIMILGGTGHLVRGNTVHDAGFGIRLGFFGNQQFESSGSRIERNVLSNIEEDALSVSGDGNMVLYNTIHGSGDIGDAPFGLAVWGQFNIVKGNQITDSRGDGILVFGNSNTLEENNSRGNAWPVSEFGCGIHFDGIDNIYRNNTLGGNEEGPLCGSLENIDGGGNIPDNFCGNGIREGTELCDGFDAGDTTCISLGYEQGQLECRGCSEVDTRGCY